MADSSNPLISDRDVDFLLYEVLDVNSLSALPYFAEHGRETYDMFLASARRMAREVLFPSYKPIDADPPVLLDGRVTVHPRLKEIYPQLVGLGMLNATRPSEVGGQQLPLTVAALASLYLMAGNLSAYGYLGLTTGAAHLIETFGSEEIRKAFMEPMYAGKWTGTMALTEPGAGSSLSDVQTKAVPAADGTYRVSGSKIFISGGDQDLTENILHMTLARIEGGPPGIKGVSLFAVPRLRLEGGKWISNDVSSAGMIHKIGWRGLPSMALNFGERGDCHGWLVGAPHQGVKYMFQMMNEARIMVGMNGVATASVAYHESLQYARNRPQGRPFTAKDPTTPQVPIIEHADVRRMLLRQKAIVEGGLSLLTTVSYYADVAGHGTSPTMRERYHRLLELLTPVAKTFAAEWGFESNTLAVQILGGYGYTSEYLPEAWLRDQKLNTIHEGTSGIQSFDLLGRKVVGEGGAAMLALQEQMTAVIGRARLAGVDPDWIAEMEKCLLVVTETTIHLAQFGIQGDPERFLRHSFHYLQMFSITALAWQWLLQAAAAQEGLKRGGGDSAFYQGKLAAAQYWFATEVPKVSVIAALCKSGEDSYAKMQSDWF